MSIEVILPVVQYDLAVDLLEMIDRNTIVPTKVIVIDNTQRTHPWIIPKNYPLMFTYSKTGRLNESWEVGRGWLSDDTDLVTFLNDDIIIGDWFFERIVDTFIRNKKYGIVIPKTVEEPLHVVKRKFNPRVFNKGIEACAFTIRKSLLDKIPPVPWKRISTFYGDNWVWAHARKMNYVTVTERGNSIYHYVGKSVIQLDLREVKKEENEEWEKIKWETWGDDP